VNKADHCRCLLKWSGKIKFDEESITEILVANTDSETGSEGGDFEDYFEEEEEDQQQQQSSARPQGTNTNIQHTVGQAKRVKESEATHIICLCVVVFHRNYSYAG